MPTSEVVYKGRIHSCADRQKITFRFGKNRQFRVGVDTCPRKQRLNDRPLAVAQITHIPRSFIFLLSCTYYTTFAPIGTASEITTLCAEC